MTRLDELISVSARPSEIFDFLDSCGTQEDVVRVFSESMFFQRLFQLDFFLTCDRPEADRLFGFADCVPAHDKSLFSMQVLLSGSGKAQYAKYRYRRKLNDMASAFGAFNPYIYLRGDTADKMRSLDGNCFASAVSGNMLALPRLLDDADFAFFADNVGYSLFQNRIAQLDFFSSLERERRKALVKGVFRTMAPRHYVRFVKSVLASDLDFADKAGVVGWMKSVGLSFCSKSGRPYYELLSECSSFQELALRDSVSGEGELSGNFALHLLIHEPENLRVWLDACGEFPPYFRPEDVDGLISYSSKRRVREDED